MRRRLTTSVVAALASASLLLAGCTGTEDSEDDAAAEGMINYLNLTDFGGGAQPQENYNPFLDATKLAAAAYVFEPLYQIETYGCTEIPWLAESYEWSDPKTLVYDIREGVKWNDGEDFTADDVAFTFNMIKEFDVLDVTGVWASLKSVEATGDNQVTLSFKEPGSSVFTLVSAIPIVPEHIWSEVKDPATFTNSEDPVGTGPMLVKSFNPQQLVAERNPDYWQADKVKVEELRWNKAEAGGPVEQLKMSRGFYDMNQAFMPDIEKSYISRDPEHRNYWYAPGGLISVYMNLTKAPFNDVEFRKALTTAFNDQEVIDKAQFGYVTEASQSGLVVPGEAEWLPEGIEDQGRIAYDPDAADKALTDAGYVLDDDGNRLDKDGNPISFTFKVPGTYFDWVDASDILIENLEALGLQVEQETPDPATHDEARQTGDYDMIFGVFGGGCNVYTNFANPLYSANTAPIGEPAVLGNEIRWEDPETDQLIEELKVATDKDAQKEAVAGIVDIMMTEVPMIPIWYGAKWFQYDTTKAEGWPNEDNPYADGGNFPIVLTHLVPSDE